jgi:hypothetical protein
VKIFSCRRRRAAEANILKKIENRHAHFCAEGDGGRRIYKKYFYIKKSVPKRHFKASNNTAERNIYFFL